MKAKNLIITLAIASLLLVSADAVSHFSAALTAKKLMQIVNQGDERYDRLRDGVHQNYWSAADDVLVVALQGVLIVIGFRMKQTQGSNRRVSE